MPLHPQSVMTPSTMPSQESPFGTNPYQLCNAGQKGTRGALTLTNMTLEPGCFFLQGYHFLFAMYSNLVYVSVIIFFFSHRFGATTRTRPLGRRLSNHNVFLKTLKFSCKRTNNIRKFEGEHSSKLS